MKSARKLCNSLCKKFHVCSVLVQSPSTDIVDKRLCIAMSASTFCRSVLGNSHAICDTQRCALSL